MEENYFYLGDYPESGHTKHLLLWSGGCDSTLLLYELCKKYGKKEGHSINCVSVEFWGLRSEKIKKEEESRKKFKKYLKSLGYNVNYAKVKIDLKLPKINWVEQGTTSGLQFFYWFSNILSFIDDNTSIYLGYIYNDSIWYTYSELESIINNSFRMVGCSGTLWRLPLSLKRKLEIINKLEEEGLLDFCWWCEEPVLDNKEIIECGKCTPCITYKLAKYEKELRDGAINSSFDR